MKKNIVIIFLLAITSSFAQHYKTYDWSKKPQHHTLSSEELKESSIGILKKHIVEYVSGTSNPNCFETEHTIVRVNDDKGIARHNTVYIPMQGVKNVIEIKARTINSKGKVMLLDQNNIKEIKNVEEYGDFKIFAIEGVEKNSEIEVLYTVEKEFDMFGSQALQTNYKIKEVEFLFITGNLNSEIKVYRTNQTFKDVSKDGQNAKVLILKDIPAMVEEEYATPNANKIEVAYQCYPIGQTYTQDMFWGNVSNNVGSKFFPESASDETNDDLALITEGKTELSNFEKASRIDNFIKTNFTIVKNNNEELTNLSYILKNRSASDYGILKAYGHYLTALEVPYEIVITANRFQFKFDPDFFIPNMLRDFIIYLPTERKYIAPDRIENRVAEAPFNITGNFGMFINSDYNYYFKKIKEEDPSYSRIYRQMDINFLNDFEKVSVKEYQEYYGHWSETNRAVLSLTSEQGMKEFKDYLTGSGIVDKDIVEYTLENTDINQLEYNKPFIVNSKILSESLIEDAGDRYIFEVGKVIGTQSELYQETERINPIEMQYPNQYDYSISVTIPEGFEVEGLNSLVIDKSYQSATGEKICKFESNYTLNDDKLVITIQEFYKSNEYDLHRYEEFREVINAASDFNKAAILIKAKDY
jgi:hypothetical protein